MSVIGQYKKDEQDMSIKGTSEVVCGGSYVHGQRVEVHGSTVTNEVTLVSSDRQAVFGRACFFSNNAGKQGLAEIGFRNSTGHTVFAGIIENVDYINNAIPLNNDLVADKTGMFNSRQATLIRKGYIRTSVTYTTSSQIIEDFKPLVGMKVYCFGNGAIGAGDTLPSGTRELGKIVTVLSDNSYIYMITI